MLTRRQSIGSLIAMVAAVAAALPCRAAAVESAFDAGSEGWTTVGDSGSPSWIASGGNPAGHIRATDTVGGISWFFRAPTAFYGDHSDAYGGILSFDMLQVDASVQYDDRDVIMTGGNVTVWYDFPNNPLTTWTHYAAVLDDAGGWRFGALAAPVAASAEQIQTVLANLADLQIRGEFRTGADSASLDNVILTPEPSGALLVLLAATFGRIARLSREENGLRSC
jgi:hypothetical protein